MLWLWVLARADGLRLPLPYFAALGLCVWSIYLLDRVIDGKRLRDRIEADSIERSELAKIPVRHRYSAAHPKLFVAILSPIALALGCLVLLRLPFQSFVIPAIGVSSLVWFYLAFSAVSISLKVRYLFVLLTLITGLIGVVQLGVFPRIIGGVVLVAACVSLLRKNGWNASSGVVKAVLCGIIFATGVTLPTLLKSMRSIGEVLTHLEWMVLSALFALNCLGICIAEGKNVKTSFKKFRFNVLSHIYAPLCILLFTISIGVALFVGSGATHKAFYVSIGLSAFLLAMANQKFGNKASGLYRVLADAALIVPPLGLLFLERL